MIGVNVLVFILLCSILLVPAFCCTGEDELGNFLSQRIRSVSLTADNKTVWISFGVLLQSIELAPDSSYLHITAHAILRWQNKQYDLTLSDPCNDSLNIRNLSVLPVDLKSYNGEGFRLIKHITTFYINGTFLSTQKFEVKVPCSPYSVEYPFGDMLCTMILYNEKRTTEHINMDWNPLLIQHPFVSALPIVNVNDLKLLYKSFQHVEEGKSADGLEKLILELLFAPELNKLILLFYFPSILIIFVCWLSMLLGPMAITRATMNMGALILLYFHYTSNWANVPTTFGISAIDVWKVATVLFIVASFCELVVVSCMASVGRSRRFTRCCRKRRRSRKGRHDVEPLYEELNDLRQRRTKTTCSCCRYSALTVDLLSLIVFAATFLLFTIFYFKKIEFIIKMLNGFDIASTVP